ncbi:MAG: trypsin-like peptidase domain-containing protein [Anaerolineae bacterium]|nr:trypsin-like peptidase domain-containing protein [Anaerolineae bacterium]
MNWKIAPGVAAEAARVVAQLRQSMVMVRGRWHGAGSGVVWRDDVILTNDHVARGDRAQVTLADGRHLDATVIGRDKTLDLAALRVPPTGLPSAPIGASRNLKVGQVVIAVGNPLGVEGAATLGIISLVGRAASGGRELVEADIDVYPGNSGGPLADVDGRVVGITSMILTPGIALAVPAHVADAALARWLGTATRRDRLGIKGWAVPLPPAWAESVGQPAGIAVGEVEPRSDAAAAGLLVGDIVVGIDDEMVSDAEALKRALYASAGPVAVRVLRGGQARTVRIGGDIV